MKQILLTAIIFALYGITSCSNNPNYDDGDEFTAQTEEGVEMKFKVIDAVNKTCQVGIGNENRETIDNQYKGKVTIPQEINGFHVVSIADYAFELCHMSKIIIPEGITTIKEDAFFMCDYLREIKLPVSLTTIEHGAFAGCDRLYSIHIPRNVEQISDRIAFGSYLSNITVDKDNKYYDSRNNCNAIIETASNTLILGCNSTIIPDGIITIGEHAFTRCEISNIKIPSSTKFIEDFAFSMIGLREIHIPQNVEMISPTAFRCYNNEIQSITVDEKNLKYDSRNNCNAIIETATETLVRGCQNTKIPSGIREIGSDAFTGCGFQSLSIPPSIEFIREKAFDRCDKLMSVELPEGLKNIGTEAFTGCSSLKTITIPSTVRFIGNGVLKDCPALEKISVASGNTSFDSRNNSNAIIHTYTNRLRAGCKNTVIPDDVVTIEEDAFTGTGVSRIVIPRNVTEIREHALGNAEVIKSLILEPYPVPTITYSDIDTLYVPIGTKEKYENTKGWNKAKNIVELDD